MNWSCNKNKKKNYYYSPSVLLSLDLQILVEGASTNDSYIFATVVWDLKGQMDNFYQVQSDFYFLPQSEHSRGYVMRHKPYSP